MPNENQNQQPDLVDEIVNRPGEFVLRMAEAAHAVGNLRAQQQAAEQRFAELHPEIKPENRHLLQAEVERLYQQDPSLRLHPHRTVDLLHANLLAMAAEQKRAEANAEQQRQAEAWAEQERQAAERAREDDIAQRLAIAEAEEEHARLANEIFLPGAAVEHASLNYNSELRQMRPAPSAEKVAAGDALDDYVAEREAERRAKFLPPVLQFDEKSRA